MPRGRGPAALLAAAGAAAALLLECQDTGSGPAPWTMAEVHATVSLDGAHRSLACAGCHGDGSLAAIEAACQACHLADYAATTDPDHVAAGYDTTCADCHTTAAWEPSTFDHEPLFPLRSGKHRRYRNSCGSCHLGAGEQAGAFAAFTCTDCHDGEHTRSATDREHDEVRDYRYESAACYHCHPRGSEDDAEGEDD